MFYALLVAVNILINAVSGVNTEPCAQTYPESPVVQLDSNFTAYCVLNESCMYTDASKLFWKIRNKKVPETQYTVLNKTVSSVTIVPSSLSDDLLTCNHLKHGEIETTLHGIFLTLGYPPDKPENLTCIVYNGEKLTCYWNPGRPTHLITNYTLRHEWASSSVIADCIPEGVNNSCSFYAPTFQFHIDTILWVEAKNALGTTKSDALRRDAANLVKPNPPEIKSLISTVQLPRALKIEWKNPMERDPSMTMKYIIRYRTNSSKEWEEVPPHDTASHRTSFTLQDLLPYTEYVVSLRCMRSNGQGYWSDWSKEAWAITPEDKPTKGPELWRRIGNPDESGNRSLRLLWKELDPMYANGKITLYTASLRRRTNEPYALAVVNVTSYDFVIPKYSFIASVIANNSIGASPPSVLAIPSGKKTEVQPAEIDVKAFPKDGKLWVEWTPLNKSIDGYVIEWCIKSEQTACEIEWQREPSTSSGAFLRGNIFPFKCYLIKVYPLYYDGRESSRSVEAYLQQGAPTTGPSVRTKKVEKYKAVLVWNPVPLDEQNGFIRNYTLTFSPSHGNVTTVVIDSSNTEYTLSSLKGDTLYNIHMTAYTENGKKDGPVYTFTTQRFANGEVEAIVVSCCIGFLILLLVGAFICFRKRDLIKKHIWPNVPDPSKSNIAQWSPHTPSRHEFNPKSSPFQDGSVTNVSVVEISEEKKSYTEQDIKSIDPLKKNTSEGFSSGIGGSSCMSSPQLSVSDGDEAESAQTTSSTVQYSTVIISGYRDQQPTAVVPHVFSRSESTQPLLESEERPDDQQALERDDHSVVSNQYFKQNCNENGTGRLQTVPQEKQPPDAVCLQNGLQDMNAGQSICSEEQSVGSQVDHVIGEIKSYLPQIARRGGYMPQ
ncbi:interleukin-6 receptor subunit beta [Spea bombifrons]|uniref:interleukin-6 receptor subunit beta n=1 Tax=Spea bombifrons TaxID=233779 RepID=UPI00234969D0|nr:interleukin-6 receptor subunit beta [Spea bombifrons]